jgi:hypothetical protein
VRELPMTGAEPPRSPGAVRAGRRRSPAATVVLVLAAVLAFTASISGTGNIASADPSADDWYRLRMCESGNNYAINTGNGYYGAYQFDLSTWRSVGGTGYAHQASPAVQDALALKLWQQRGWSPWACAGIIGLSGSPSDAPPSPPPSPIGHLDAATGSQLTATVSGWALDPSSPTTSIDIHIYVNQVGVARSANKPRADVNAALGVYGQHGFTEQVPLRPGANNVCVYAIGTSGGNNALIQCRTVVGMVPPAGYVDSITASGWNVTAGGWTFDPNSTPTSIPVHLYVNGGFGAQGTANLPRGDVNAAFGITGQHGFSVTANGKLARGPNTVCAYAIGVTQGGNNVPIGCRTVQGPVPPIGNLDVVSASGSQAYVAGWAIDQNAPSASIGVHIYVNSTGRAFDANQPRGDVNAVMGVGGQHGYSVLVPLQSGFNNVCVYAIGVAGNNNTSIGCRGVQYSGVQSLQQVAPPESAARLAAPSTSSPASTEPAPSSAASFSAAVTGSAAPSTSVPPLVIPPVVPPSTAVSTTASATPSTAAPSTGASPSPTASAGPATTSAAAPITGPPPSTVLTTPTAVPVAAGGIDPLVITGLTGALTGWIAAPVTTDEGTRLRVTVNGVTHDVLASTVRNDVTEAGLPGAPLGFTDVLTLTKGSNEVCVYEIDSDGGISTAPLACRVEQVR